MTEEQQTLPGVDIDEHALVEAEHTRGIFSGVNLRQYDPEKYNLIIEMLASDDYSISQIARATKSSRNLISAIRLHQVEEIEHLRAKIARGAAHVAELCQERQIEILTDPSSKPRLGELAVAQGVAIDKMQVLTGGATSRLEVISGTGPEHDDFVREMGLVGVSLHQNAPALAAGDDDIDPSGDPAPGPGATREQ